MRSLIVVSALMCVSIISTSKASPSCGNRCKQDSSDRSESVLGSDGGLSVPDDTSITITPITPSVELGEGPYWCHTTGQLYFVDILQGNVNKFSPKSGQLSTYKVCNGSFAGFIIGIEGTTDQFIVGCGRNVTLIHLDFESDTLKSNMQTLASVDVDRSDTRFNDAKVDSVGRLWGGTMAVKINSIVAPERGALYTVDSKLTVTKKLSPVSISNGLAWNNDNSKMYYIDSATRQVVSFDFDLQQGDISNSQVVFDFNTFNLTGIPDGMTIDTDDNLWVAQHEGGAILHIDPRNGKLLKTISIPSVLVTSVAFGDESLDTLYVTSARQDNDEANSKEPDGGRIFAIKGLGVRGLVPNRFKIDLSIVSNVSK